MKRSGLRYSAEWQRTRAWPSYFMIIVAPLLALVLMAAGASPLETQDARVGPYQLLLSFYSLPRAGQELNMTIETKKPGEVLHFSQARLDPAKSTDANTVSVQIHPEEDNQNASSIVATPPIRGIWLLHITIAGAAGTVVGDIPIDVGGPPEIPTWLGWCIGLLPLPLLMTFIWFQVGRVGRRRGEHERLSREMQSRPTF
ncbi:MAG: hypothetical protein IMW89_03670 [Ktedonobacteraceae bacterium]|nr:hypothetical protein [Ktedonobacteraceae bacterium]